MLLDLENFAKPLANRKFPKSPNCSATSECVTSPTDTKKCAQPTEHIRAIPTIGSSLPPFSASAL